MYVWFDDREAEFESAGSDVVDLWCMELNRLHGGSASAGLILRHSSCGMTFSRVGMYEHYWNVEDIDPGITDSSEVCEDCGEGFWGSWQEMTII